METPYDSQLVNFPNNGIVPQAITQPSQAAGSSNKIIRQKKERAGSQDVGLQHEHAMLDKQLKEQKAKCRALCDWLMTLDRMLRAPRSKEEMREIVEQQANIRQKRKRQLREEMREATEDQAEIKEAQFEVREKWEEEMIELQDRVKRLKLMCHCGNISELHSAGQPAGTQDVHLLHKNAKRKQLKEIKAKNKACLERIMKLDRMVKHIC